MFKSVLGGAAVLVLCATGAIAQEAGKTYVQLHASVVLPGAEVFDATLDDGVVRFTATYGIPTGK